MRVAEKLLVLNTSDVLRSIELGFVRSNRGLSVRVGEIRHAFIAGCHVSIDCTCFQTCKNEKKTRGHKATGERKRVIERKRKGGEEEREGLEEEEHMAKEASKVNFSLSV